ncbi:MAG: hypothetical protein R2877_04515 [Bdellovibrionota bacterium]
MKFLIFSKSTEMPTRAPFNMQQKGLDIVLIDKPELTQTQFSLVSLVFLFYP